jgi:uncharacterized protein YcbK (DUF882 family)
VKLRVALPGEAIEFPLAVVGDPMTLRYVWVPVSDTATAVDSVRALAGANLIAPAQPGLYRLVLVRGMQRRVVDGLTVGVLVPFSEKFGSTTLNGYRIGTYRAERRADPQRERPEGFLPVGPTELGLQITTHLRLSDFVAHDGQTTWPRYVALNPRLLDKLELVVAQLARERGTRPRLTVDFDVDVHSGFRTPLYNRLVRRAAGDSRHQYGDAADVAIDADGDGRLDARDSRLVARAVDAVERDHPDLVGGMGLYTSPRYRTPYVHIDARGRRARWRG